MPDSTVYRPRRQVSQLFLEVLEDRCGPSGHGPLLSSSLSDLVLIAATPSLFATVDNVVSDSPALAPASSASALDNISIAADSVTARNDDLVQSTTPLATVNLAGSFAQGELSEELVQSTPPTIGHFGIDDSASTAATMATQIPTDASANVRIAGNFHSWVGAKLGQVDRKELFIHASAGATAQAIAVVFEKPGSLVTRFFGSRAIIGGSGETAFGNERGSHSGPEFETQSRPDEMPDVHNLNKEAASLESRGDKDRIERRDSQSAADPNSDAHNAASEADQVGSLDEKRKLGIERRDLEQAPNRASVDVTPMGPALVQLAARPLSDLAPRPHDHSLPDSDRIGVSADEQKRGSQLPATNRGAAADEAPASPSEIGATDQADGTTSAAADKSATATNPVAMDPQEAGLLTRFQPLDTSALNKVLAQYMDQLSDLGREAANAFGELGPSMWLVVSAMCVVGYEVARQRRRRMILDKTDELD